MLPDRGGAFPPSSFWRGECAWALAACSARFFCRLLVAVAAAHWNPVPVLLSSTPHADVESHSCAAFHKSHQGFSHGDLLLKCFVFIVLKDSVSLFPGVSILCGNLQAAGVGLAPVQQTEGSSSCRAEEKGVSSQLFPFPTFGVTRELCPQSWAADPSRLPTQYTPTQPSTSLDASVSWCGRGSACGFLVDYRAHSLI